MVKTIFIALWILSIALMLVFAVLAFRTNKHIFISLMWVSIAFMWACVAMMNL